MLAFFFLTGSAILGIGLVRQPLRRLLNTAELLLWGVVCGWTIVTACVYVVAASMGRLTRGQVLWTTLIIWFLAIFLLSPVFVKFRRRAGDRWWHQYKGLALTLVVFAPIYWRLFRTHMLAPGNGGIYSGGTAWFDLSFHAALSSSFAFGNNFPAIYPSLPPHPLLYPFMPDFQTAILMVAGLDLYNALIASALPLAFVITGLFYSLAFRIATSQRIAMLASILFLLNGGFGFIDLLADWRTSGDSFLNFWNTLSVNYTNAWDRQLHWTNIITDTFLPQRTSLYGLAIGVMVITVFAVFWQRDFEAPKDSPSNATILFIAGLLTGILPLFHPHTFIAVQLIGLLLFALRRRRAWLAFWIPSLLLIAPRLWTMGHHAVVSDFIRVHPGWMGQGSGNLLVYLLRNFGLPLLLVVPAWFCVPRVWRLFYLPFVVLFLVALMVAVSPNVYDNGKLMYYWYALTCILIASCLVRLASNRWRALLAVLAVFVCIASGLAALQSEDLAVTVLFSDEQIAAAQFARDHTDPHAVFLAAPVINQPIQSLAGRRLLRGPTSWLWSHGYEFREREADVKRIYAGAPDALELLRYYDVDYVYVGDAERTQLSARDEVFKNNFNVAYSNDAVTIYDARKDAGRVSRLNFFEPQPREARSRLGKDPFILLQEFPRTSFFVYRLLKVLTGNMPREDDFMKGMEVVVQGLYFGAQGWESRLETNLQTLIQQSVLTEDFRQRSDRMSNREYVDGLLHNAGSTIDAQSRDEIVKRLDAGLDSRASVLRRIVDDKQFYKAEYNSAFVLVHFFGYLDRNPADPPDHDLNGFYYWRDVLHKSGDYGSISRAFLESDEYKRRPVK